MDAKHYGEKLVKWSIVRFYLLLFECDKWFWERIVEVQLGFFHFYMNSVNEFIGSSGRWWISIIMIKLNNTQKFV